MSIHKNPVEAERISIFAPNISKSIFMEQILWWIISLLHSQHVLGHHIQDWKLSLYIPNLDNYSKTSFPNQKKEIKEKKKKF